MGRRVGVARCGARDAPHCLSERRRDTERALDVNVPYRTAAAGATPRDGRNGVAATYGELGVGKVLVAVDVQKAGQAAEDRSDVVGEHRGRAPANARQPGQMAAFPVVALLGALRLQAGQTIKLAAAHRAPVAVRSVGREPQANAGVDPH